MSIALYEKRKLEAGRGVNRHWASAKQQNGTSKYPLFYLLLLRN